ncbi:MAG: hypothetical protein AAB916_01175 [Patescibacteria group bacterium]
MRIAIHSIQGTRWQGMASKLICYTSLGQMTVLDHHIPLVSSITGPNVEVVSAEGKKEIIPVSSGFIEVRPESEVIVLTQ